MTEIGGTSLTIKRKTVYFLCLAFAINVTFACTIYNDYSSCFKTKGWIWLCNV